MNHEYIISIPPTENDPFKIKLTGITYENPDYSITRIKSDCCVAEYVISGNGYVEINGKTYSVGAGDMYILPFNSNHIYYSDKQTPWRKIWFNSDGILLGTLLRIYGLDGIHIFKNTNGYGYMKRILDICGEKLSGKEINKLSSFVLLELICHLAELEHSGSGKTDDEAEKLKTHIDTNIEKNITIKELSKLIFRSESQTIRIFKKAYNQTPYDYLLSQKIKNANLLLQNTGLSVKEIASRLSFCDEHYFSNLYKKRTRKRPSDFRTKQ